MLSAGRYRANPDAAGVLQTSDRAFPESMVLILQG